MGPDATIDLQINEAARTIEGLQRWLAQAQRLKDATQAAQGLQQELTGLEADLSAFRAERKLYEQVAALECLPVDTAHQALQRTTLGQRLVLIGAAATESTSAMEVEPDEGLSEFGAESLPDIPDDEADEAPTMETEDDLLSVPAIEDEAPAMENAADESEVALPADTLEAMTEDLFFDRDFDGGDVLSDAMDEFVPAASENDSQPISAEAEPEFDTTDEEAAGPDTSFAGLFTDEGLDIGNGADDWIDELAGMNLDELDALPTTPESSRQSMNDLLFSDIGDDPDSPWADPWDTMMSGDEDAPKDAPTLEDAPEAESEWGAVPVLPQPVAMGAPGPAETAPKKQGFLQKLFFRE